MTIRPATDADALWAIIETTLAPGDTWAFAPDALWLRGEELSVPGGTSRL
jgi:hypothetical protein